MQIEMLYSPYPPAAYTRPNEDGHSIGIGRELGFEGQRALWNLYWLSDPRIDFYLGDDAHWADAPVIKWEFIKETAKTVNRQKLGGVMVGPMLLTLTPTQFVDRLNESKHDHLFVARVFGAGWLDTVTQRSKLYRGTLAVEGTVRYANFGRRPVDQKVEQVLTGSATIMPLA